MSFAVLGAGKFAFSEVPPLDTYWCLDGSVIVE